MSDHDTNNVALKEHEAWIDNIFIQGVSFWSMVNDEEPFSEREALKIAKKQSKAFNNSLDKVFKNKL
ncbi:hypothetical protein [uncultured Gammaproteobacteria bacterium]|nr:hypothetical protein [uncultured Gammaproteobacteria bacterium]CAC9958818.1 hypothetical protein [uncultured Gammaproteobacteria bacterium]